MYFGRIHPKILEFQFSFFWSHVGCVRGERLSIEVFRLVTSEFLSVSERHRRSAYELCVYQCYRVPYNKETPV